VNGEWSRANAFSLFTHHHSLFTIPHAAALSASQHRLRPLEFGAMAKHYWLVKQEPEDYPWPAFVKEGRAAWTGVRNYQARNNLRAMKKGDPVFYYHSGSEKQVVGLARVEREAYPDPSAEEGDWSAADLAPVKGLNRPVTLETIKADQVLREMLLARNSRLSVSPLTEEQYRRVLELSNTKP
jgi:predicted RNA-binding protein with PUA-like domain